jgi:hypothetical protein
MAGAAAGRLLLLPQGPKTREADLRVRDLDVLARPVHCVEESILVSYSSPDIKRIRQRKGSPGIGMLSSARYTSSRVGSSTTSLAAGRRAIQAPLSILCIYGVSRLRYAASEWLYSPWLGEPGPDVVVRRRHFGVRVLLGGRSHLVAARTGLRFLLGRKIADAESRHVAWGANG